MFNFGQCQLYGLQEMSGILECLFWLLWISDNDLAWVLWSQVCPFPSESTEEQRWKTVIVTTTVEESRAATKWSPESLDQRNNSGTILYHFLLQV